MVNSTGVSRPAPRETLNFLGKRLRYDELPEKLPAPGEYNIAEHLAGPLQELSWREALTELERAQLVGHSHLLYAEWQKKYGGEQGLSANIVTPKLLVCRERGDTGKVHIPIRTQQVVIGNPDDAARIARVHVKKQPNFTTAFLGSIISTVDNESWRNQREHLVTAFLPKLSLSRIFPISVARAKFCADRYNSLSDNGSKAIDMNDFFLYETQAQLQLALFGEDQEFMESTNEPFRRAMGGEHKAEFVRDFCHSLSQRFSRDSNSCPVNKIGDNDGRGAAEAGCPFKGPLANRIASLDDQRPSTIQGNALIFAFAGHDTTAHTLTWLLLELARHPHYQAQLQSEVDDFFRDLDGRDPEYADLKRLPFMTRCIMETLRLWPAVAPGTYRELQFDDYIVGPGGKQVRLPAGTYVQIPNWSRHRNPALWGDDVNEFNPNREFVESEIWNNEVLAAYNPATPRFSPFTFPPRGCIGMNFAHLEARLIIANLLHRYTFHLTAPYKGIPDDEMEQLGINYGTMAIRDLTQPKVVSYPHGGFLQQNRTPTGVAFTARPRQPGAGKSKL